MNSNFLSSHLSCFFLYFWLLIFHLNTVNFTLCGTQFWVLMNASSWRTKTWCRTVPSASHPNPLVLPPSVKPSPAQQSLATTDLFFIPIVLPFSKCFQHEEMWLLSLTIMHLRLTLLNVYIFRIVTHRSLSQLNRSQDADQIVQHTLYKRLSANEVNLQDIHGRPTRFLRISYQQKHYQLFKEKREKKRRLLNPLLKFLNAGNRLIKLVSWKYVLPLR